MLRFLLLASLSSVASPAAAEGSPPVGEALSSFLGGVGPDGGVRLSDRLGVRARVARLGDLGLVPVELVDHLKLRSGGAMADFYPLGSGFRLSAGIRRNEVRGLVGAAALPWLQMRSSYRIRAWAPSLTMGYVRNWGNGLTAGAEAGALFQGVPRVRRNATSTLMAMENEFEDGKLRPLVQMSLGYRF